MAVIHVFKEQPGSLVGCATERTLRLAAENNSQSGVIRAVLFHSVKNTASCMSLSCTRIVTVLSVWWMFWLQRGCPGGVSEPGLHGRCRAVLLCARGSAQNLQIHHPHQTGLCARLVGARSLRPFRRNL